MLAKRERYGVFEYYEALISAFGPQGWWPGETPIEVAVGAILTQNTAWTNVEKAIGNLKRAGALSYGALHSLPDEDLAALIRPAGYFNVKAKRLKSFLNHVSLCHGNLKAFLGLPPERLRAELLSINGIGPETADSISLYAAGYGEFVVDAYTRRIFARHGFFGADASYDEMKAIFTSNLPEDKTIFNEYHALIVKTGKDFCKTRVPLCKTCPLGPFLDKKAHPHARETNNAPYAKNKRSR
ncbi:MAG: hypothetical protein A2X99_07560 [Deltaproteobacteria bacterium GWB2_55_19]|nr:MAG: hypothetical protein A2X99_07560 [Deltaproteobacteria bacterium GWB2_55_19]HAO93727.1 endonuclease [Deltaproteobacteria bacterium]